MASERKLTAAQLQLLKALNDPTGKTYIGGFDVTMVFEAERAGLVAASRDPVWPSFLAYRITEAGRRALAQQGETRMTDFITITNDFGRITSPTPRDETVVEVKLEDGRVIAAWYSCNIGEPGDWDFLPLTDDGEPDFDADSIADQVVAWRPSAPSPAPERER